MLDTFGSPFIGYIDNGGYEGLDNTADGSYLRRADQNLKFNSMSPSFIHIHLLNNLHS